MPTYLRWIAALSTGITAQFVFLMVTIPFAPEAGSGDSTTVVQLTGVGGVFLTLGNAVIGMCAALWLNNWILKRYPKES